MKSRKIIKGLTVLLVGLILLANTLGILEWSVWLNVIKLWPLFLVSAGLSLIFKERNISFLGPLIIFLTIIIAAGTSYTGISFEREISTEAKTLSGEIITKIKKVSIELNLDVGKLTLGESTPLLYECISQYTYKEFEPFEKFSYTEKEANILIYHSPVIKRRISSNIKNHWQLKLNNKIIYDLSIKTGAISNDCDLSNFKIEKLYVKSGISNFNLVIPEYDSKIIIDTGVSNIDIAIPKNVGAIVTIDSGIAIKDLDGFIKKNDTYISNNYNNSEFKTEIKINCGVLSANIHLIDGVRVKYDNENQDKKQVTLKSNQSPKEEKKYYLNKSKYEIAKEIESIQKNPIYTQSGKKEKIRIIQKNVGEELFASIMRLVPVIDPEKKKIKPFDKYAKEMVKDSPGSSPFKEDPVGATIKIFFDPSQKNIKEMLNLEEMFK